MGEARAGAGPARGRVIAAFAAVYIIWGSTYLAIRIGIETIPPFLLAGVRFLIAGGALYAWVAMRERVHATRSQWLAAARVGALLLVCGNGAVVWAEQRVPSGITSLLVATLPLWMVVLDWLRPGGRRPGTAVFIGIALGLLGLGLLVEPGEFVTGAAVDHVGAAVLVLGSLSWAAGSLLSRRSNLPASPLLATSMEMLAGGVLLIIAAALSGEMSRFAPHAVAPRSVLALLYLVCFGSLVGFTCYIWLLRVASPSHVATYAYVNPVVAVILGWLVAGEPLTMRTIAAAVVIIAAVVVITGGRSSGSRTQEAGSRARVVARR